MKKALVLGASGGMGYAIVNELSNRGIKVVAFARNKQKLDRLFKADPNVVIHPGNVFNHIELEQATRDVDVIFQAINIPYAEWKTNLIPLNEQVISAAKNVLAKIAVVDNIYAYGKSNGERITETTPKNPHTKKGKLRLDMERLYKNSDVPYLIVHFPDFYGPHAENAQLNYTIRQIIANKNAQFIGKQHIRREHIYTPDGAKAIVELALREDSYGQNWNIPAYDVISGEELIKMIRGITGYTKKVSTVTKNMLRFVGIFDKQMREFVEMQYLAEEPVILSGEKYEKHIGPVPKTAYKDGLKETIQSYI